MTYRLVIEVKGQQFARDTELSLEPVPGSWVRVGKQSFKVLTFMQGDDGLCSVFLASTTYDVSRIGFVVDTGQAHPGEGGIFDHATA